MISNITKLDDGNAFCIIVIPFDCGDVSTHTRTRNNAKQNCNADREPTRWCEYGPKFNRYANSWIKTLMRYLKYRKALVTNTELET